MIKDIALKKNITVKKIAKAFFPPRYQNNECKIFRLKDLNVEDAIRISHALDYNLLEMISEKYLSHLPSSRSDLKYAYDFMILNFQTGSYQIHRIKKDNDSWKHIHIGQYIKELVQKKGWSEHFLAKQSGSSQSLISYYYNRKSMNIKQLIRFSNALNYNLIAELYLVKMNFNNSLYNFNDLVIKLNTQNSCTEDREEGTFDLLITS